MQLFDPLLPSLPNQPCHSRTTHRGGSVRKDESGAVLPALSWHSRDKEEIEENAARECRMMN